MFVDEVHVTLSAGRGGNGAIALRREANIPKGGPWGGDGGRGADIILRADPNHNTLSDFRYKKKFSAPNGGNGEQKDMHGANGENLILSVPVGTIVRDKNDEIIYDLSTPGESLRICRGGRGGYGNAHFTSPIRQKPMFAELGDKGEEIKVTLELKLVADIGIIGLPSAGKSTLISCLTNARPKIADYPFTTLVPNLGIMEHKEHSLVLEDVPGLIPGAHKGEGLGIQFLKHIQRTKSLLHLLDVSKAEECIADYKAIRQELKLFDPDMLKKEEIIILAKIDLISKHDLDTLMEMMKDEFPDKKIFALSAPINLGLRELKDYLIQHFSPDLESMEKQEAPKNIIDLREKTDPNTFEIEELGGYEYHLTGDRIQQIVRMSDPRNKEATSRIYDVLMKRGILDELERLAKKQFEKDNPDASLEKSEVWYHVGEDGKLLIEKRVFPLIRIMYMSDR